MKSFIQLEYSENSLGLMPCRIKNQKSLPKVDISKDLNLIMPDVESKDNECRSLLALNMGIYNLKNTYKDKKKIKDAVTVKKMNLVCKENVQNKRMPMLINFIKRNSLNFSAGGIQFHRRSCQKSPLKLFSKKASDSQIGLRTFTSPTSPAVIHDRKALKLQRLQKENELGQTIFETKHLQANSKSEALINTKLKSYINTIKQGRKLHNMSQQINKEAKKKSLRVRIKRGNNSQLIKWLFKKRWWWTIEDEKQSRQKYKTNFIWSQLKQKSFFEAQNTQQYSQSSSQIVNQYSSHNHFPQNEYLGNKKALFYNMSYYYKSKGIDVFEKLPLTYHVTHLEDQSWRDFTSKYEQLKRNGQNNIWILKPGENSNRGRGITVHQSYEQMKSIVGSGQTFVDHHDSKVKQRTYIIQLYIDKPFLYNKRKFDIRCYMLLVNINNTVKGYWYSEGYIRTSSFQFQLNDFNTFVHLTNDAIQNHSESYGKYEDGNKVSYQQFQKYLDSKFTGCGYDLQKQIVPQMKEIATDSMKAALHLIKGDKQQKPVFQIFGLDFMIDKNFRPWLIQINTNPCIETSCLVLEKVIPRMLDDALKLSLDLLFPPPQNWPGSRKHCLPSPENKFQLVYQQCKDEQSKINKIEFPSLGVITQDGEVYDEKQNECN